MVSRIRLRVLSMVKHRCRTTAWEVLRPSTGWSKMASQVRSISPALSKNSCKPHAHACALHEMMSNALGGLVLSVFWVGWVFRSRVRKREIDGGRERGREGASKKLFRPSLDGALPGEGRCALNEVSISVDIHLAPDRGPLIGHFQ